MILAEKANKERVSEAAEEIKKARGLRAPVKQTQPQRKRRKETLKEPELEGFVSSGGGGLAREVVLTDSESDESGEEEEESSSEEESE